MLILKLRSRNVFHMNRTIIYNGKKSFHPNSLQHTCRLYTSSDGGMENRNKEEYSRIQHVVDKLNSALSKYPQESIVFLFASDIASIFGVYTLLNLSGIQFPPEFAIAFAVSRPLRKVRLPLDLAVTAALANLCPATTKVQLSVLTNSFPGLPQSKTDKNSLLAKSSSLMKGVVDKYGAAYLIGSRIAGVGSVALLYAAIKQGVDVMPLLEQFGIEEVGSVLGSWAGAVVLSSTVYPLTLGITGYAAPALSKLRSTIAP